MKFFNIVLVCVSLIAGFGCKTTPPVYPVSPPYVQSLHLYSDDIGVTEAWLKVHLSDTTHSRLVKIFRDTVSIFNGFIVSTDTLILDTTLQPNSIYNYRAYRFNNSAKIDSSGKVTIQTLNTTSHNFTWYLDTLGDGPSSSFLGDVTVINDTDAWAVGELHYVDSLGQYTTPLYNAAHWDGTRWNLLRVYLPDCVDADTELSYLQVTYSFDDNHLWLLDGQSIIQKVGQSIFRLCIPYSQVTGTTLKVWGTNDQSVYAVGSIGTMVYYDGTNWSKVVSGTTANINDIWGDTTLGSSNIQIIAAVTNRDQLGEMKLLKINSPQSVDTLSWSPQVEIHSVWFKGRSKLFVVGDGVFMGRNGVWQVQHLLPYYSTRVRGTGVNNVIVVGAFGACSHFDGVTWRNYPQFYLATGSLECLDVKGKFIVAGGYIGGQAVILRGYQQ